MTLGRYVVITSALAAMPLAAAQVGAQVTTGTITGRVVHGGTQQPLVGVRVSLVGDTAVGTLTREDGRFTLPGVRAGARRVRITRLGFTPIEQAVTVAAGTPAVVTASMQPTALALSEVVVVGYGTQRREDLTGSIASVNQTELQQTTVTTLEQGLQGRVAGVQVTQGDAAPGGGMRVQIRGVNSMNPGSAQPLYVIDGVPVQGSDRPKASGIQGDLVSLTETNPLATISPSDIESIDILKDASATAIYGSRGANGVVIITTKRGRRNEAGQFTANYSQGYASVVRQIPVLNAPDFANYVNTAFVNAFGAGSRPYGDRPGSRTPEQIAQEVGTGTNWQDQIFTTAPVYDGQIGFNGGDEQGSYAITGNLLQQAGVIRGSEFRRGGVRVNLDRNVNSRLRVSSNLAVTRTVNDMVRSSTISGFRSVGIVRQAITYTPMQFRDTTQADPRAEDAATWATYGANPLRYTDEVNENDQRTRGVGGLKGIITLGGGFALDLSVGANYDRQTYGAYYPRTVNEGRASNGDAVAAGNEFGNIVSENLLRWNRDFGGQKHRLDAIGGFTFQNDRYTWNNQQVRNFPDDLLGGNVLQNGTEPLRPNSGVGRSQLASYLGRVNYNLLDRYLFTATVRADGSSKFAANNKWATFPAVAFAWKAIDEDFLSGQRFLSDLKLRASWGKSGNQAIGAFQSLPAISGTGMTLNEAVVPAYIVTQLGNPNLRWETTTQYDAGVDFGLLDNRLTATVDVYRKNTFDLLQNITLAGNTGFGSAWINSGNVSNRGIELTASYDVLRARGARSLTWNLGANASLNRNRIESLGPVKQQFAGRLGAGGGLEAAPFIQKPGLPIGVMWGYTTDGLVRTPQDSAAYRQILGSAARVGDVRYKDLNGDGKINADDQGVIGDANADWVYGITNRFTFGRFDASALITAVTGNDIINAERLRYLTLDGSMNVPQEFVKNSFDPVTNPNGTYPQIRQDRKADARFSDIYIEDGSFIRLKNVQLGYNVSLPNARTARIYLNGINLLTRTNYTGFDPEVSAFGSPDRPGVDLGSYPQSRIISFGINTTF